MTRRIRLVHLTAVGSTVAPASIEFGARLTVIHGASDTGKSHVFELINYVFGLSQTIELPPEGKGYQFVRLGLWTEDDGAVTLVRDLSGGPVGVVDGDVHELASGPAREYLRPKHISKDPRSVSRYLLSHIELDAQLVRKNQNNETRMLEWRDVMRLAAVDEESILAKRSPIEFGQYSDRPVQAAIFRFFIEGEDDSGLTPIPKAAELKKISANKLEVLDQVIASLEQELAASPSMGELQAQLARLNGYVLAASKELQNVSAARDDLVLQRSVRADRLAVLRERYDELRNLEGRFGLLLDQYTSDISRLEMLAQATDVLRVGEDGECPFCGADPAHQHWPEAAAGTADAATFVTAIVSEQSKIEALREDLGQTIRAITAERRVTESETESLTAAVTQLTSDIRLLDSEIKNPGNDLAQLLDTRSRVEREINANTRLLDLLTLRTSLAQIEKPKTSTEVPIAGNDLHEFDTVAQEMLRRWAFPSDSTVHYSTQDRDLVVDQRARRTRGKGVRSILHALFTVALAEYCIKRNHRHPGFVILDSPIVTYRQPGEPELSGEDETISVNVVDAFYAYLQNQFPGQSLILENKSPLSPLPSGSREYFFGGDAGKAERAGFYPQAAP